MLEYNQSVTDLLTKHSVKLGQGLTTKKAASLVEKFGLNKLTIKTDALWRKLLEPFLDVFMLVLIVAGLISIVQHHVVDFVIIMIIIAINAAIYYIQQFSTSRILRSLRKQTQQMVKAWRNGQKTTIGIEQLVPGDIIALNEGDRVPADGRVVELSNLKIDEAILTGESEPIVKSINALRGSREVYDRTNMVFAGTFVITGTATVLVTNTGNNTEYGRIAKLASNVTILSPVQVKINKLVTQIAIVVGIISLVTLVIAIYQGIPFLNSLQFVVAMAVSAVPEGMPVAISIILALGMRRMAAKKALVTNMRAIETIGTINTIATDKTGTLTENKLSVQDTWQLPGSRDNLPQAVALSANDFEVTHDPLDLALDRFVKVKNTTLAENEPIKTFTFDQKLPISGNLWYYGSKYRLSLKGNPEVLIEQCRLSENDRETCQQALNQLTAEGYRVLALAEVILNVKETSLGTIWSKHHPKFVGLIGVKDTLRPEAKKAIAQAKRAGVTVRMITGDHFETAFQIGKQLGLLARRDQVFDCQQMDMLEESNLQTVVRDALAFSRVTPEDKLKILSILKDSQVVAMTGDGVNDVPALVGAHVGIAMGSGATIAKDAGDIILLDDNFSNIVEAMKEGRIIVSNIRRMLYYLLATNAGEAITAIGALFLKSTMIFTPVQILWVNFVTDSFLVFPLGLEPAENQTMRRKPDDPSAPILSKTLIVRMVLVATSLAALALGVYTYYLGRYGHAGASTLAFAALIVAQWSNAVNARSFFQSVLVRLRTPNVSFYICMAVAIGLQLLVFFGPLGSILHIASVPLASLAIVCAIAFVAPIILVELHKLIAYYLKRNRRTR